MEPVPLAGLVDSLADRAIDQRILPQVAVGPSGQQDCDDGHRYGPGDGDGSRIRQDRLEAFHFKYFFSA